MSQRDDDKTIDFVWVRRWCWAECVVYVLEVSKDVGLNSGEGEGVKREPYDAVSTPISAWYVWACSLDIVAPTRCALLDSHSYRGACINAAAS